MRRRVFGNHRKIEYTPFSVPGVVLDVLESTGVGPIERSEWFLKIESGVVGGLKVEVRSDS